MQQERIEIFDRIAAELKNQDFTVVKQDLNRPWGGFYQVADDQASQFTATYFPGTELPETTIGATLSPKILMVMKNEELSLQYHDRRGEFWQVVEGPVGVALSETDEPPAQPTVYQTGDVVDIPQGIRHQLIGLQNPGVVAEIWIHTDPNHPSDEDDIHRLRDRYGRQD